LTSLSTDTSAHNERGAVAIIVVGLLVAFIGLGAYVIDVGALFEEKRDLQNGADAAALAIAQDCALQDLCTPAKAQPEAERMASLNSDDGQATVNAADITFDAATQTVTVIARTKDASDGDGEIDFVLAPTIGEQSEAVTAEASVVWGAVGGATTVPIIISSCEWNNSTNGGMDYGPAFETTVYFHSSADADLLCKDGPGFDIDGDGDRTEGGFGFLDSASSCSAVVLEGDFILGEPGNGNPGSLGCTSDGLLGSDILIPIFDDITANGGSCSSPSGQNCYHVYGFAAFHVTGFYFSGAGWKQPNPAPCNGSLRCIRGYFTRFVTLEEVSPGGPGTPDLGVYVVGLSG